MVILGPVIHADRFQIDSRLAELLWNPEHSVIIVEAVESTIEPRVFQRFGDINKLCLLWLAQVRIYTSSMETNFHSYVLDCALPGQPGVYAKMTAALDWVNEVTGNCNFRTCNEGNCVAKEDLGSASRYFSR